jgi:hypothetical protein
MRVAFNIAKMAKEGFLRAAIEETKYLIQKPRAKVQEEKRWSVEFPGHKQVKAEIHRDPTMLRQNQTSGCLPSHNGTAKNPQTSCRRKATGAPPPTRRGVQTPEPTAPPPGKPLAPTGNTCRL